MTEKDMAKLALQFLERVQLVGKEVNTYLAVNMWLANKTKEPKDDTTSD